MKTYLYVILIAVSCFLPRVVSCQVQYEYDAAGNRELRKLAVELQSAEIPQDSSLASRSVFAEESVAVELGKPQIEETLEELEVRVYPNPTQGAVFLELSKLPENILPEIEIWSPAGRLIGKSKITGSLTRINLWGQPSGIYIVKTKLEGKPFNWKIIKK